MGMPRMTVGGRTLDLDQQQVLRAMRDVAPEPLREHLVEIADTQFPPKQVLATVTGWDRQSFTTMEAQRMLNRLGFVCRRAATPAHPAIAATTSPPGPTMEQRVDALQAGLVVANQAIAALTARITDLEARC
jgi:hypothetical protein